MIKESLSKDISIASKACVAAQATINFVLPVIGRMKNAARRRRNRELFPKMHRVNTSVHAMSLNNFQAMM
jgi:hypothetical protein